jgi:hypothetical protein
VRLAVDLVLKDHEGTHLPRWLLHFGRPPGIVHMAGSVQVGRHLGRGYPPVVGMIAGRNHDFVADKGCIVFSESFVVFRDTADHDFGRRILDHLGGSIFGQLRAGLRR